MEQRRCAGGDRPSYLYEFLAQSFELNLEELNAIHASLSVHRKKWSNIYLPICNSLFAHSLQDQDDIMAERLGQTNTIDLKAMVVHLRDVMNGFEDLYINGAHLRLGSRPIQEKEEIEENTRGLLHVLLNGYKKSNGWTY